VIGDVRYLQTMSKEKFLKNQYLDVLSSGKPVCERWQSSFQNFYDDMIDATPARPGRRYLGLRVRDSEFAPENVEWHFHTALNPKRERAASEFYERQKAERRRLIAEEYHTWEARTSGRLK